MNNHKPTAQQFTRAREKNSKKKKIQSFAEQEVSLLMQRMNVINIISLQIH